MGDVGSGVTGPGGVAELREAAADVPSAVDLVGSAGHPVSGVLENVGRRSISNVLVMGPGVPLTSVLGLPAKSVACTATVCWPLERFRTVVFSTVPPPQGSKAPPSRLQRKPRTRSVSRDSLTRMG